MSRWDYVLTRNPNPNRAPECFSLDELRYHIRRFWAEPMYGISILHGAKTAFIDRCGEESAAFNAIFLTEPPKVEYLSRERQIMVSRAVRQVLTGRLKFVKDPRSGDVVGYMDLRSRTHVPAKVAREIRFKIDGPNITRLPPVDI